MTTGYPRPPDRRLPPPGYGYPNAGMPNYPHANRMPVHQWQNGYGVAGFVLGLLSTLFGWIPVFGVISWILAPLAIILGGLGIGRASKGMANNKGLALTGVLLGCLGLLFCFVYLAAFSSAIGGSAPNRTYSAPTSAAPGLLGQPASTEAATPSAPGPTPSNQFGDGMYEVGSDLPAGTYKTPGDGNSMGCYYARLKDDTGDFGTIIANDIGKGPRSVTVKSGEYVEFSGGCTWTKVK